MIVFRMVGWTRGKEKVKRREAEAEKRCSIVGGNVRPAACSHRFTIHLVHCGFFFKKQIRQKKVH